MKNKNSLQTKKNTKRNVSASVEKSKRTMSITRALATLKRLKKEISSFNENDKILSYVYNNKHNIDMVVFPTGYSIEDASKLVKSNTDSIIGKLEEYNNIKVAIANANVKNKVEFRGEKYSLYELMVKKDMIEDTRNVYYEMLKSCRKSNEAKQTYYGEQERNLEERRDSMIKANKSQKEIERFLESEKSEFHVVSTWTVDELLKKIEDLDTSKSEIDVVLSEANATTMIEY